ncbi:uncharacterized protein PRCAT00004778001 [Priceomyces carsonii]|uniref:uncharacterized protein n=1 Tax=Priceomyces carsonii TaxID=28549 RepID=UPI002ED91418|nr:unnamed protein product [Priceomyces carsonii]
MSFLAEKKKNYIKINNPLDIDSLRLKFIVIMDRDEDESDTLGVKLVDQDQLESSITQRANEALISKDAELDQKRLEKSTRDLNKTLGKIRSLQKRLENPKTKLSQRKQLKDEIEWYNENELHPLKQDIQDITERLNDNRNQLNHSKEKKINQVTDERLPGETEKDFLIRTGKITAFGNANSFQQDDNGKGEAAKSHVFLKEPGFEPSNESSNEPSIFEEVNDDDYVYDEEGPRKRKKRLEEEAEYEHEHSSLGSAGVDLDGATKEQESKEESIGEQEDSEDVSVLKLLSRNVDDGDERVYQIRLKDWIKRRSALRENDEEKDKEEWFKPHPKIPDAILNSKFRLPGDIYPSLFDYQKTCVQWLWELYSQKTGGIIGDEMGLGKTIQIISFIAGLHYSGLLEKPVLVVVPATVLNQWVNEFHRWWPPLRCIILHSIGSGMTSVASEDKLDEFLEMNDPESSKGIVKNVSSQINAQEVINRVMEKGHVLVTTYVGLRIYSKYILPKEWGYCILDEGHKIRNPNLDISLTCKQVKTYNRIILSGTPIQNNLIELWSLFDFVFPGRLGTLPVFEQQFAIPINMGGYANASNVQVQTGYKCAVILRDLISPYLLRRLKVDVAKDLPKKNEMVLFVKLTRTQQDLYETFLQSEDLNSILKGKRNVLMGVDILRKICNHPDLVYRDQLMYKSNYGNPSKSGKMQVLKNLLQIWESENHKILLFCQTKQMLDILEKFVSRLKILDRETGEENQSLQYFTYLRMDGTTPISRRQDLVDRFNEDKSIKVFLLTTKVGGLGINLTGADRVIIYDPDWNPSTDIQARERAWRLGQKKDITIYRLMTTGTIEEKIYHRQIFKTFLTNKILKDPKQRRFFKVNDLHDLFTLGDQDEAGTETGNLFHGSERNISGGKTRPSNKYMKKHDNDDDFYQVANIMGVSKLDKYEGGEEDDEANNNGSNSKDENRIMENIFASKGVHSALKHDSIVDSNNQEYSLIEREANKVATQAAESLRRSRKLTRKKNIGTPTWTGKFGLAGKFGPQKKSKSSLASTSILQDLKQQKDIGSISPITSGPEKGTPPSRSDFKKDLMPKLISYLKECPSYFSLSNDILKHLKVQVDKDEIIILVRSMLREIAQWNLEKKGWLLKEEFREEPEPKDINS